MDSLIISHLTLRKLIGYLGIALAPLCILGGLIFAGETQGSISAYYNSNMRDLVVGVLTIMSAFLLTYKGYDLKDNIVTSITGVTGLAIAVFPSSAATELYGMFQLSPSTSYMIHLVATGIFFLTMAFMSFFQFTKSPEKKKQNLIYRISGISLVVGIAVLAIFSKVGIPYFTLIIETIMLAIFGFTWLVKGKSLFPTNII